MKKSLPFLLHSLSFNSPILKRSLYDRALIFGLHLLLLSSSLALLLLLLFLLLVVVLNADDAAGCRVVLAGVRKGNRVGGKDDVAVDVGVVLGDVDTAAVVEDDDEVEGEAVVCC